VAAKGSCTGRRAPLIMQVCVMYGLFLAGVTIRSIVPTLVPSNCLTSIVALYFSEWLGNVLIVCVISSY